MRTVKNITYNTDNTRPHLAVCGPVSVYLKNPIECTKRPSPKALAGSCVAGNNG